MDQQLAIAQALKYAEELHLLHRSERAQRHAAEEALERLEASYGMMVRALAAALELRDDDTGGHADRVTRLGLRLTREVAPELAASPELEYGFLLHDLGKIGIPDAILLKPGPLTEAETATMRYHTVLGEQIVAGIPYLANVARDVVRSHHERWDGNGYPEGLRGTEIPLAARVFSIVDSYDAMTSERPYRPALPVRHALREISRGAGTQFDPQLADAFLSLRRELKEAA